MPPKQRRPVQSTALGVCPYTTLLHVQRGTGLEHEVVTDVPAPALTERPRIVETRAGCHVDAGAERDREVHRWTIVERYARPVRRVRYVVRRACPIRELVGHVLARAVLYANRAVVVVTEAGANTRTLDLCAVIVRLTIVREADCAREAVRAMVNEAVVDLLQRADEVTGVGRIISCRDRLAGCILAARRGDARDRVAVRNGAVRVHAGRRN